MPEQFDYLDISVLEADREAYQRRSDALAVTITEATTEKATIDDKIVQITGLIVYLQAGSPEPDILEPIIVMTLEQTEANEATLDWMLPTDAEKTVIHVSQTEDFAIYDEVFNDTGTTTILTLTPNILYYIRAKVTAVGFGDSDWSDYTMIVYPKLLAVDNFVLDASVAAEISGTFDAVPFAESYHVTRNTVDDFDTSTTVKDDIAQAFTDDTGIASATHYYYWVVSKGTGYFRSDPTAADIISHV